jgi:hypothetical protein
MTTLGAKEIYKRYVSSLPASEQLRLIIMLAQGLASEDRADEQQTQSSGQRAKSASRAERNGSSKPLVGEELAAVLDQVAALPYSPHLDGRIDISTHHDDILYTKHGKAP